MEVITKSAEETAETGRELSNILKSGDVVALSGDLGAGKTTFIQGLAAGIGIKDRVTSPTFIIMRDYGKLIHVDLYRLENNVKEELDNLGLLDIIKEGKSIVVIEWAERITGLLPDNTKWIDIKILSESKRVISLKNYSK